MALPQSPWQGGIAPPAQRPCLIEGATVMRSLPQTVRVKLSSEVAEAISITPVVVQELPVRELIEHMLGITGKDGPRVRELLRRGTLVSGASRFRWVGWEADIEGVRQILAAFPDADPP